MINLSLPENKKEVLREYRHRILTGYGIAIGSLLAIAVIVVGTLYAAQLLEKSSLTARLDQEKKRDGGDQYENYPSRIEKANKMIAFLAEDNNNLHSASGVLERIVAARPVGIKISAVNIEQNGKSQWVLSLRGRSTQRKNITDFISNLQKDPLFASVDSPFANLIKDAHSDFSMTITLATAQ